ncbi:HAD-like protein [Pleurotus eryngii]|uniref:HAD-like protein n=1 Tax=Pleurotus eryngii TaxID=5323 RepID=A0A9P6DA30_PLEER|nr:HAD-like protein [Pleurotus eryngii]
MAWHRLKGKCSSTSKLSESSSGVARDMIIAVLSNGNMRSLIDLAKHSNLPWDVVLSTELFDTYKPNPEVYRGVAYHLSLEPSQCAMVAAHEFDVRLAASHGMKTVYVRRGEDPPSMEVMKSKKDGGEFDLVVDSIEEFANLFAK